MRSTIAIERLLREQYHPCPTGLHVCGIDDEGNRPVGPHFTVLNLVAADADAARRLFDAGKIECAANEDVESDFIVDLMIDGDHVDDFPMMRQMLERLRIVAGASL